MISSRRHSRLEGIFREYRGRLYRYLRRRLANEDYAQELAQEAFLRLLRVKRRPFRVLTHDGVIQAVGTRFNVYHRANATTVTVVEGTVIVSHAAAAVPVTAGRRAQLHASGAPITVSEADLAAEIGWRGLDGSISPHRVARAAGSRTSRAVRSVGADRKLSPGRAGCLRAWAAVWVFALLSLVSLVAVARHPGASAPSRRDLDAVTDASAQTLKSIRRKGHTATP